LPRFLHLLSLDPEETYQELLEISSALIDAFDTAVASMYPTQAVDDIERAINRLGEQSLTLTHVVRSRLDRSQSDIEKLESCRLFLTKWVQRLEKEESLWDERGLAMSSLDYALPK
jgi:hypothetical protein